MNQNKKQNRCVSQEIDYPVIGMSPGNSYFKEEVVINLLKKVVEKYGRAVILIADHPAVSTYVALGYPENRAWRDKALPQSNNLKNKVKRAMVVLGYSYEQVKIINWKDEIENSDIYKEKYTEVLKLYEKNMSFQKSVEETTKQVLEYSDKEITDLFPSIKIAVHYLLSEIAFMEFSPYFLNCKKVVYVYHKQWPVYESYISGDFDQKVREYLGFNIIKYLE